MPKNRPVSTLAGLLDARPLVRASRFELAGLRARGVPAILLGAAGIVVASGIARALARGATAFPETLREARLLWLAVRDERRELAS